VRDIKLSATRSTRHQKIVLTAAETLLDGIVVRGVWWQKEEFVAYEASSVEGYTPDMKALKQWVHTFVFNNFLEGITLVYAAVVHNDRLQAMFFHLGKLL
jgi:hypothetical protein